MFLRLQKQLHSEREVRDPRAWLYRAARNAIIDHYRTRKDGAEIQETTWIEEAPERTDRGRVMASFRRMIGGLPDEYREAVILADLEECPQREVAERLGLSLPAAKSRILRGRRLLRKRLDACCWFERDPRGTVIGCTPKRTCPQA